MEDANLKIEPEVNFGSIFIYDDGGYVIIHL